MVQYGAVRENTDDVVPTNPHPNTPTPHSWVDKVVTDQLVQRKACLQRLRRVPPAVAGLVLAALTAVVVVTAALAG